MCAAACARPATFAEFGGDGVTALCSAVRADGTRAAGWQLASGKATCTIVDGAEAVAAADYACLCLDAGEAQGLSRGRAGTACETTCDKSLLGDAGRAVAVGGGDHACLATAEQGVQNRFASEVAPGACVGARGPAAVGTDQYSCVCVFDTAARAAATAPAAIPQLARAVGGVPEGARVFDR
jgi:hypothetical protein